MPAIFLWLQGLLPVLFAWGLQAYLAIKGMHFGLRLILIGAIGALLPLPDFVEELPGRIAALPSGFLYFADFIELQFAIYVMIAAFTYRWVFGQISKSL